MQLSPKLRSYRGRDHSGIIHWCPGCRDPHSICTEQRGNGGERPRWSWDGNVDAPTCSPSVLFYTTFEDDEGEVLLPNGGRRTLCHYFLRAGNIEFCGDSAHQFAGRIVPLPDYPLWRDTP